MFNWLLLPLFLYILSQIFDDLSRSVTHTAQSAVHGQELTASGQETIVASVSAINDLSTQLAEVDSMITKLSDAANYWGSRTEDALVNELTTRDLI